MSTLDIYLDLFSSYIAGKISSGEFRETYLDSYLSDNSIIEECLYQILEQAFGDAEMFEPDPVLYAELERNHPGMYLSEEEFRRRTNITFLKLKDYAAQMN